MRRSTALILILLALASAAFAGFTIINKNVITVEYEKSLRLIGGDHVTFIVTRGTEGVVLASLDRDVPDGFQLNLSCVIYGSKETINE